MRADTAVIGCEADHQIIKPGVWNEAKLPEQRIGTVVVQVRSLHQQGPVVLG